MRGSVQGIYAGFVHDGVGLNSNTCWFAGKVVLDFSIDPLDQAIADRVGGDQEALVIGGAGVATELVEQVRNVFAYGWVSGQQAKVFVATGGFWVVVASTNVGVAA